MENYWSTQNDVEIITMGELKEALKKTKNGKSPGEDNLNSDLYKHAGVSFHERLLIF
jgi:hypothetical protein